MVSEEGFFTFPEIGISFLHCTRTARIIIAKNKFKNLKCFIRSAGIIYRFRVNFARTVPRTKDFLKYHRTLKAKKSDLFLSFVHLQIPLRRLLPGKIIIHVRVYKALHQFFIVINMKRTINSMYRIFGRSRTEINSAAAT